MMRKAILLHLLLILFSRALFGQDNQDFFSANANIVPPSPAASSLGKYGEYPVSLYTGLPQIDIPLYEVGTNSVKVPISVSYHASGIKVGEVGSSVGLGWALNAGGVITRTVEGLPDELNLPTFKGFLSQGNQPATDLLDPTNPDDYARMQALAKGTLDWQPDQFFYNFNGHSGEFVLSSVDGRPHTIPYENIKIEGSPTTNWTITTEDGTKYIFSQTESITYSSTCQQDSYYANGISSWYLSEIIPANSAQTIFFTYVVKPSLLLDSYLKSETNFYAVPGNDDYCNSFNPTPQTCFNNLNYGGIRLAKITYPDGSITFKEDLERNDLPNDSALTEIDVFNRVGTTIKKFLFTYTNGLRLTLNSIVEQAADGSQKPPYVFSYDNRNLPAVGSNSQDHWGYFNNAGNSSLIPFIQGINAFGANRETDTGFIKAGSLNKITYPTGGYCVFEMENNKYGYDMIGDSIESYVGNLTTASVFAQDANQKTKTFTLNSPQYVQIFVTKGTAEDEAGFIIGGVAHDFGDGTISNYYLDAGTYTLYAISYSTISTGISIQYTATSSNPVKYIDAGGLRIKKMIISDGSNHSNDQEIDYNYDIPNNPGRSSGHLISQPVYTYPYTIYHLLNSDGAILDIPCNYWCVTSSSQALLGQSKGGIVGYTDVTVTRTSPGNPISALNGETHYQYSFFSITSGQNYPFPPITTHDWVRGLLLEQTDYDISNKPVSKIINHYNITDPNNDTEIVGVKVGYRSTSQSFQEDNHFNATTFRYSSQWTYMDNSTQYFYDPIDTNIKVIRTQSYVYDPLNTKVSQVSSTNSDGTAYITNFKYPDDYTICPSCTMDNNTTAIRQMQKDKLHMSDRIIEKIQRMQKSGGSVVTLGASLVVYKQFATNQILPYQQYETETTTSIANFVNSTVNQGTFSKDTHYTLRNSITAYDIFGNPLTFQKPNYIPISYIWNASGTHPLAEIKNAQSTQCFYSSFESDGSAENWSYTGETSGGAKTGENFIQSQEYVPLPLVPAGTYILSFWAKGAATVNVGYSKSYTSTADNNGWIFHLYYLNTFSGNNNSITINLTSALDEVRIYPQGSQMKTLTYDFLFDQVNSISDENDLPTSFDYDSFGRLAWVYDDSGNIKSHSIYQYFNPNNSFSHNYITTYTPLASGVLQDQMDKQPFLVREHDDYYDGLGRLIQSNDKKQSPQYADLVQIHEFDNLGREAKQYLPFAETGNEEPDGFYSSAVGDQTNFFSQQKGVAHTIYPFSQTGYDNSPLNRVVEQSAPGTSWVLGGGHTVQTTYRANGANEILRFQNINNQWDASNSWYPAGTLYATDVKDENGNESVTFKDILGRVVCEEKQKGTTSGNPNIRVTYPVFVSTYYIYNDLGDLIYVIQPQGITAMQQASSNVLNSSILANYTFQYLYDNRQRLKSKLVPGGGKEFTVYDDLDRVAVTQDANLRQANQWKFIKYDIFSRPVMSGIYTDNTNNTLTLMSSYITSFYGQSGNYRYEKRIAASSGTNHVGYSNQSFPAMSYNLLESVNFYDDYDFDNNGTDDFMPTVSKTVRTIGKSTGSYTLMLGKTNFIKSAMFYDDQYRIVETDGINFTGGTEKEVNEYDFTGNLLQTAHTHNGTYTVTHDFRCDQAGRKTDEYLAVNNYPQVWVSHTDYNELGQLADKDLNDRYAATGQGNTCVGCEVLASQQSIQYLYNPRGWLTDINNVKELSTSNSDYFAEKLHYDTITTRSAAQFNGNISFAEWGSDRDGAKRQYFYSYDPLDRITGAYYQAYAQGATTISEADRYSVNTLAYDDNGNIQTMNVRGFKSTGSGGNPIYKYIDSLTYSYTGNILNSVNDAITGGTSTLSDFRSGTNNTYTYDLNGNIKNEHNKNLTIYYNDLNLPDSLTKSTTKYEGIYYDATGTKLKESITNGTKVTSNKYFGDIIDESNNKTRINFTDGYALEDRSHLMSFITYFYYIKDHLGNTRIVFHGDSANTGVYTLTMEPGQDSIGNSYGQWQNVNAARSAEAAYQGLYSAKVGDSTDTTMRLTVLTADSSTNDSTRLPEGTGPYITLPATQGDSLHVSVYYYAKDSTDTMHTTAQRRFDLPVTIVPAMMPLITTSSEGFRPQKRMVAGAGLQLNIGAILNLFKKRHKNTTTLQSPVINDSAEISFKLIDTANNIVKTWTVSTPVTPVNSGIWTLSSSAFKITLPDSTQAYTIQISLVNNNVSNVFYDTMRIVQNTPSGPIVQEDDYYPYGNLIDGLTYQNTVYDTNFYKYNGKQLDNDFAEDIYDYGARYYDPQIGRFLELDPLSRKFPSFSSYSYALNNPINAIDINGLEATYDWGSKKYMENGKEVSWGSVKQEYGIGDNSGSSADMGSDNSVGTPVKPVPIFDFDDGNTPSDNTQTMQNGTDKQNASTLSLSSQGLEFIKLHEGFSGMIYIDKTGNPTIGYGHKLTQNEIESETYENGITIEQATELLAGDVSIAVEAVRALVKTNLSQFQFDAIVDFTFNVGRGTLHPAEGLIGSDFLRELNSGNANGNLLLHYLLPASIVGRRNDEVKLFNTGDYGIPNNLNVTQ